MKKLIAVVVIVLGFAFNTNAQEVKTISLEQTKGEFTQKQITVSEGTYIFEVSNNNAAPEVGIVLIKDGTDGTNPKNHITEAYVSKLVKHGKKESSKKVILKKGAYKYFCPYNKTAQYTLIVE
jgi:hypothetical protein